MITVEFLLALRNWINRCECSCDSCLGVRLVLAGQDALLLAIQVADHDVRLGRGYDC